MATGKIYIKILIKFSGEMRVKPIQVKRFLIKLKVKESISFEIKEYCSNLNVDKDGKTYNKIDFNLKTNLRIRNKNEIKDLVMKEPVFNTQLNLLSQKNYLITNNEIHKKFVFIKENLSNANANTKHDLDFITNNLPLDMRDNTVAEDTATKGKGANKKTNGNNYIVDKFNKILNTNGNIIFFPWVAKNITTSDKPKKSKTVDNPEDMIESDNCRPIESVLQGLYPYKLKGKNSEATKIFLSYLFNKYTEISVTTKKINSEKTLIKMILTLNKIGLSSMGDKIDKYEIYANGSQRQFVWLGPKKFVVKNNLEENTFTCRFNFITTLKGVIEVNRISVLVYKRSENESGEISTINLNHITKPTSILIE